MNTTKTLLTWIGYGFLLWLIPFVSAFAFYSSTGELRVSQDLFKSTMIVISSLTAAWICFTYFSKQSTAYLSKSIGLGITLLVVNFLLDVIILIPYAKMSFAFYFESIGLRYFQIPVMPVLIGFILNKKMP